MSVSRTLKQSDPRPFGTTKPVLAREIATMIDGLDANIEMAQRVQHGLTHFAVEHDFTLKAGATLELPWVASNNGAGGSPVLDYVTSAACGQFQLLNDNTSEAQNLTLSHGDHLLLDIDKEPWMFLRFKIDADAIPWTADQRIVAGLAAARDATLDDNTLHAWFRMEGAAADLLWETDDGTTDDDDNDTGIDVADDTWLDLAIVVVGTGASSVAKFFGRSGTGAFAFLGKGVLAAASGNVQPYFESQRDAGTETEDVRLDYVAYGARR